MNQLEKMYMDLSVCDKQIVECLLKRNAIVEKIAEHQKSNHTYFQQPARERRIEQELLECLEKQRHAEELINIFNNIIYNGRKIQAGCLFDYNIFLIGFMGCGKTTVSECLGRLFAVETVEMDRVIADQEQMSIPDIFAVHGEEYFRNCETNLLAALQSQKGVVVSCGGGTPMRGQNVAQMKKNGRIVLLTAKPETIYARVKNSDDRPLLKGNKNIPYIAGLMEQRREKYEAAADVAVETDGKKAEEICQELMRKLLELDKQCKQQEGHAKNGSTGFGEEK